MQTLHEDSYLEALYINFMAMHIIEHDKLILRNHYAGPWADQGHQQWHLVIVNHFVMGCVWIFDDMVSEFLLEIHHSKS
jgi:hypothetical protein